MKKIAYLYTLFFIVSTFSATAQSGYMGKKNLISINPVGLVDYNKHITVEWWHALSRYRGFIISAGLNHFAAPPSDLEIVRGHTIELNDSQRLIYNGITHGGQMNMFRVGAEYVVQNNLIGMAIPIGFFVKYGIEIGVGSFKQTGTLLGAAEVDRGPLPSFAPTQAYNERFGLFTLTFKETFGRNFLLSPKFGMGVGVTWQFKTAFTSADQYGVKSPFTYSGGFLNSLTQSDGKQNSIFDPYFGFGDGVDFRLTLYPYFTAFYLLK
jgi:hypothetical protein